MCVGLCVLVVLKGHWGPHRSLTSEAQLGFERARFVVNAGMDNSAVVTSLVCSQLLFLVAFESASGIRFRDKKSVSF